MQPEAIYELYENLYIALQKIVRDSEKRVTASTPDSLFSSNVNFFVKAYMINICTYLEAYLQDIAFWYSGEINGRLKEAEIPHNYIYWRLINEVKSDKLVFGKADYPVSKRDIDDNLSVNPGRTIAAFRLLGVDLTKIETFKSSKAIVGAVVEKRNNIIHHNDDAMDISFSDLLSYIDTFVKYMGAINSAFIVSDQPTPPVTSPV